MKPVFRFQLARGLGSRAAWPLGMLAAAASPLLAAPGAPTNAPPSAAPRAGSVIISELRPSGPNGAGDSFIELFNATSKPLSLSGWALRFGDVKGDTRLKLAPGTQIGARAHLLLVGADYSLQNLTRGDVRFKAQMFGGSGLYGAAGLFDGKGQLIDAFGIASAAAKTREGAGFSVLALDPAQGKEQVPQYSYLRRALDGQPQDTGDNARDFVLISVSGALFGQKTAIGVPGPENAASPRLRPAAPVAQVSDAATPNPLTPDATALAQPVAVQLDPERNSMRRARRDTGPIKTFGTMTLRYRLTNDSARPIKSLWFRVSSLTCDPDLPTSTVTAIGAPPAETGAEAGVPDGIADIRLIRGKAAPAVPPTTAGSVAAKGGAPAKSGAATGVANAKAPQRTLSVWKAKLSPAPSQPLGGGLNAWLEVELPAGGIAPGARGEVTFSFGVERRGNYRVVLSNGSMNLVFEGNTEDDLSQGGDGSIFAAMPGGARNGMRSGTSMSRGGGATSGGAPGAVGAVAGTAAEKDPNVDVADGIILEGNTEDGVIVPPVKPSGNPT